MLKLKKFFKRNRYIYLLAQRFHFIIKKIYCITVKIFCIGLEPKVVFSSFKGKTYSDSPKAISEKLHEKYPEIKIVWLFKDVKAKQKIVPSYVKCVKAGTLRERSELYTAKCWIDNFPKESCEIKTKKQLYIQTFHGDRAIKKVGFDKKAEHGKVIDMLETKKCDLFLAGSDMGEHVARSAFRYSGTVLKIGIPRNDILIKQSSEKIHNITEKLGGGRKGFFYMPLLFGMKRKEKYKKCLVWT